MQFDPLVWMKRTTLLVFLAFLSYSAYRLIDATEIDLTLFKQLVPAAFYALFPIQMLYYFAWYNHEHRQKAGDSVEMALAYQRLKQEIKVLALVQGMIFIVLYLGTTVVAAR